jgi:hypothetical protein
MSPLVGASDVKECSLVMTVFNDSLVDSLIGTASISLLAVAANGFDKETEVSVELVDKKGAKTGRIMVAAMLCQGTHSLTHWLTHWLTGLLAYSLTVSLAYSLTHLLTHSLTYSLTYLLTGLLTHSSITHSLAYSLTHSLTHSLTYSLTQVNLV